MTWDDQRVAALAEGWLEGASSAEIARRLGGGINDKAVRCKARRMRLPKRPVSSRERVRNAHSRLRRVRSADALPPTPVVEDPTDIAGVSFLDREDGECAWPIGDPASPDFGCCGEAAVDARPYCAAHMMRAYDRIDPAVEPPYQRATPIRKLDEARRRELKGRESTPDLVEVFSK